MQITNRPLKGSGNSALLLTALLLAGCSSPGYRAQVATPPPSPAPVAPVAPATPAPPAKPAPPTPPTPVVPPAPVATPATPVVAPAAAHALPPVRIKAGPSASFTDADGNAWLPEQGFVGGDTVDRPDLEIANTKTPQIYRSERYSMTAFAYPVPNGKYTVKLHFAETFEGIAGPGERVFSFNVEGHEFKDFDVWVKSGGALHAYIETVPVEVTDGSLDISFTPKVENPEINGVEILPGS